MQLRELQAKVKSFMLTAPNTWVFPFSAPGKDLVDFVTQKCEENGYAHIIAASEVVVSEATLKWIRLHTRVMKETVREMKTAATHAAGHRHPPPH